MPNTDSPKRIQKMIDLHDPTTLGLSIAAAFPVVATRYGVRLEGIEDDANEHSDFWQQVAREIANQNPSNA